MPGRSDPTDELVALSALGAVCALAGLWRAERAVRVRIRDYWYDRRRREIEEAQRRRGCSSPGSKVSPFSPAMISAAMKVISSFEWRGPIRSEEIPERRSSEPLEGWRVWLIVVLETLASYPATIVAEYESPDQALPPVELDREYYLRSLGREFRWEGPVVDAGGPPADLDPMSVHRGLPRPPDFGRGETYGIYAWRKEGYAMVHAISMREAIDDGRWSAPHHAVGVAYGSLELFGKVVVHTDGFRAEKARLTKIVHTWTDPSWIRREGSRAVRELLADLEDRYRCDVTPLREEGGMHIWPV